MNNSIFGDSILRKLVQDIEDDIARNGFFGAATASTAAAAPLPPLTKDVFADMIKALAAPKPRKGFNVLSGIRVVVDKNCYKRRVEVYGIADKNRPNNKKPLYRKRVVIVPLMYIVSGDTIVCHPSLADGLRRQIGISDMPYQNPLGIWSFAGLCR